MKRRKLHKSDREVGRPSIEMLKRKRRQKVRRNRLLLMLFFIFFIISGFKFFRSDIFKIQRIVIRGNEKVDSQKIQEKASLEIGKPIFHMKKNKIVEDLEKIPYIKKVKCSRSLSGKIEITVEERTPLAQIYYDEWYFLLDKDLRILEKTNEFHPDMIKITGLNMKGIKPGQYLFQDDKQIKEEELFKFILDSELAEKIQSVEFGENSCNFVSKDDIKIIFGSFTNGKYKAKQLIEVLKEIEGMDKKVLMVLMEKGKDPIAVTESPSGKKPELTSPMEEEDKTLED
ncbi:MAG: FtsQ-type POTRA domain-containing protein [Tissierellia bacterium]|nr:FtsQ-type POTRA domain-containing protein [Tissierellia bacterium]